MIKPLFFLLLSISIAHAVAPCGGAAVGFWTNPDGSRGGWVAKTAKVQAGAVIAPKAQVCEYAQVKSGAKILDSAVISGTATVLAGSEISDLARVSGQSKIQNAIICQASVIEGFDVIDSDYYCQTEDPEPPHPGELGKKTLLGVDSDRDGVRDDVEIWINQRFSNTKDMDRYNYRMAYKQIAIGKLKAYKYKDNKEKAVAAMREVFDAQSCLNSFHIKNDMKLNDKLRANSQLRRDMDEMYLITNNTKERIKAELNIRRYFHGTLLTGTNKTSDGCYFLKK